MLPVPALFGGLTGADLEELVQHDSLASRIFATVIVEVANSVLFYPCTSLIVLFSKELLLLL
jgi:hypothetical protein